MCMLICFFLALLDHCRKEGVSDADMKRVEQNWKQAGALWTIFLPQDNDDIRKYVLDRVSRAYINLLTAVYAVNVETIHVEF